MRDIKFSAQAGAPGSLVVFAYQRQVAVYAVPVQPSIYPIGYVFLP
jgi:hypothetical protein